MDGQNFPVGKHRGFSPFKFIFIGFAFFILLNLAYIDWLFFLGSKQDIIQESTSFNSSVSPITQIHQPPPSLTLLLTPQPTVSVETRTSAGAKEFFIPLGSGSGFANDWQDI